MCHFTLHRSLVERMAYKLMGVLRSNAYKVLGKHTKCWEKAKGNLVTWARVGENDTKVLMISKMNTQDQMRLSVNSLTFWIKPDSVGYEDC